ncbi:MAG: DPP IV N-terminal domain-containing protein, partial [Thioalkalivibrio sp.]|nr:DPP IV N-terminal domain-containing protein [Thioalkalivibrio sp.]
MNPRIVRALPFVLVILSSPLAAQDRLKAMPGYTQYAEMAPKIPRAMVSGALVPRWADDGRSFEYTRDGKRWRYDLAARRATELDTAGTGNTGGVGGRRGAGVARGRQATEAWSPDSSMKAVYRERNLFVSRGDGSGEKQLTTDGSETARIKYGTASWVYGEELDQNTAIWWSPDGSKVAFYRFDENPVTDYVLQMDQTKVQSSAMIEAYPKAGTDNPIVDLYVHDIASGTTTTVDVRNGRPFTDDVVGHYVYRVTWSPDGSELLVNRTNRRQNIMEFTACHPDTGACRV